MWIVSLLMSVVLSFTSTVWESRTQWRYNEARELHSLSRLKPDPCADQYAERWARVLRDQDDFRHRPNLYRMNTNCDASAVGEVLARGGLSPRDVVEAWLASPGHRKVLLKPRYDHIGVGAVRAHDGRWITVVNVIDTEKNSRVDAESP